MRERAAAKEQPWRAHGIERAAVRGKKGSSTAGIVVEEIGSLNRHRRGRLRVQHEPCLQKTGWDIALKRPIVGRGRD